MLSFNSGLYKSGLKSADYNWLNIQLAYHLCILDLNHPVIYRLAVELYTLLQLTGSLWEVYDALVSLFWGKKWQTYTNSVQY